MSHTFVIPANYEENFNSNINHFKDIVDEMSQSKKLITNSKVNKKGRDKKYDLLLVNALINHNNNMAKMYQLEKMLFKMVFSPPKDNFVKIITSMREKFYEASSNAMDTCKVLVDLEFKKEQDYIELCNQFKKRMEQYTDMCETIKENGGDYKVETC
jgi:hypothetical protein